MVLPLTGLITPLTAIAAAASPPESTAAAQRKASSIVVRIGIIGGGAAGLAATRAFLRANEERDDVRFDVTTLEARDSVGGIWSYDEDDPSAETRRPKSRPMYRNLRTNLPRELMAFREFAWGGDGEGSSYIRRKRNLLRSHCCIVY
ncbi:hypothetical protein ACHAW5_003208 [Stephanodiscus triporus]|uniref:Flavin-containing monooxygenase n=1 Tax=Stephanodiscus triporus TaxID=2934178 RepID=A0ABD3P881_9STRA